MIKEFARILKKIIRFKIVLTYLCLFVFIAFLPVKIIPDYLMLGKLQSKKELLFRLLTTIISFSGLILTVLLVAYNFFIKTIRRNTLEFIIDNNWLKLIFSCFFGNVLFLFFAFFSVETYGIINDLSVLYWSYIITLTFILSLFPLAILSLNDSVSFKKVDKLIQLIKEKHVNELYHSNSSDENWHHEIEKNPILILRDITSNAITDKDWILPQTVLNKLFDILIKPINSETQASKIKENIFVWYIFSNHIKRDVIKHNDIVTGRNLLSNNLEIHYHFAENKVINTNFYEVDNFLKDYLQLIIQNNLFAEMQPDLIQYMVNIIKVHFSNIQYSDEELPTSPYRITLQQSIKYDIVPPVRNYWYYLTHNIHELVFKTLEFAIESKRRAVYDFFSLSINSVLDSIYINQNQLTEFQKEDAINCILWQAEQISNYAINNNIYKDLDTVSEFQIVNWFKKNTRIGYKGFFTFLRIIDHLREKDALSEYYIDKFFMISRELIVDKFETNTLFVIIDHTLKKSFEILKINSTSMKTRKNFLYQLNWFKNTFLDVEEILIPIKEKYDKDLKFFLNGYDYRTHWE